MLFRMQEKRENKEEKEMKFKKWWKDWGYIVSFLIVVALMFTGLALQGKNRREKTNEACMNLGGEKYVRLNGLQACEDIRGNILFVKLTCNGKDIDEVWWIKNCIATPIKVGEVWSGQ